MKTAYHDLLNFMASGPSAEQLRTYQPSRQATYRVEKLLSQEKQQELSEAESAELEIYYQLNDCLKMVQKRIESS